MRFGLSGRAITFICALVVNLNTSSFAGAQGLDPARPQLAAAKILMTPFFAIGDDVTPGGGASFTFNWTQQLSVEAEASLGTDAARSSVSVLYALPRFGRFAIYLASGGGVQRDEARNIVEPSTTLLVS